MFVDMRGSTTLAEQRLPFDTVFVVNRLSAISEAVIECGGQPDQFVGVGELALFGFNTSPQTACRCCKCKDVVLTENRHYRLGKSLQAFSG